MPQAKRLREPVNDISRSVRPPSHIAVLAARVISTNTPIRVLCRAAITASFATRLLPFERLEAYMAAVAMADDLLSVHHLLDHEIRRLGFDRFTYIQLTMPRAQRKRVYLSSYPTDWVRHYLAQELRHIDPVWGKPFRTLLPFLWRDIQPDRQAERLIFGPAADAGMRAGGGVPIHGPEGMVASLNVTSDCSSDDFARYFVDNRHELQLIGIAAHERVMQLGDAQPAGRDHHLTRRQYDVLLWTVRGKTNWEIGEILGISEDTVRQHVGRVCDMLGAKNRAQATAIAIIRQLIVP